MRAVVDLAVEDLALAGAAGAVAAAVGQHQVGGHRGGEHGVAVVAGERVVAGLYGNLVRHVRLSDGLMAHGEALCASGNGRGWTTA